MEAGGMIEDRHRIHSIGYRLACAPSVANASIIRAVSFASTESFAVNGLAPDTHTQTRSLSRLSASAT